MSDPQPAILAPVPPHGRFLTFDLAPGGDARRVRDALARLHRDADARASMPIVGIGEPLVRALGATIPALRPFPALVGAGASFPSTQGALWLALGGDDPGALLHAARALVATLGDDLRLSEDVASFVYDGGRDLSGYEDGTENPRDERAREVAIASGDAPGLAGGSFVAVQRWVHELGRLEALTPSERDHVFGRSRATNEELADAPASAHVKRTAQESFEPPAFMLRRSMPWGSVDEHGLYFVAYGATLDPFERALRRMVGLDDGVVDALLRFSSARSGGYYWCPPLADGQLALTAVGG